MQPFLIQLYREETDFWKEDLLQNCLVTIREVHATFNWFKIQREGKGAGGKERETKEEDKFQVLLIYWR